MFCFVIFWWGRVFFLLHVLLIQLCHLLISQWHKWTLTRRHKQMCPDTMWPSYTTQQGRVFIYIRYCSSPQQRYHCKVHLYGVCLSASVCSQTGGELLSIQLPGGEDPDQREIKLTIKRSEALLTRLFPEVPTVNKVKKSAMFFRIPRLTPGYIRYLQVRMVLKGDFCLWVDK